MMPARITELSAATIREREEASRDIAPAIVRCLHCPEWIFRGTALEAREAAALHRTEAHPELRPKHRRQVRQLGVWRSSKLHPEVEAEILSERNRRARLHGLQLEER